MANARVSVVDFRIQTDIHQNGEECTVGFNYDGGSAGFAANLARGEAIMKAVGYSDGAEYDPVTGALHIIFKPRART
jgi:hypothetical protein